MTSKTADEVLEDFELEFDTDDRPIIAHLSWKVSNLARQWRVFLYFFCGPKERVSVLNEASGGTARMLQGLLWDNALLTIRRLTDPETTMVHSNLSMAQLPRIGKDRGVDLNVAYEKMMKDCKSARDYSTKFLAHLDMDHVLGSKEITATRGQTTQAIRAICAFLSVFHETVRDTSVQLMPLTRPEDEQQFLLRLFQGNAAAKASEAAKVAALDRGDWRLPDPGDIPDWVWRSSQEDLFLDD